MIDPSENVVGYHAAKIASITVKFINCAKIGGYENDFSDVIKQHHFESSDTPFARRTFLTRNTIDT